MGTTGMGSVLQVELQARLQACLGVWYQAWLQLLGGPCRISSDTDQNGPRAVKSQSAVPGYRNCNTICRTFQTHQALVWLLLGIFWSPALNLTPMQEAKHSAKRDIKEYSCLSCVQTHS